jgi:hypothetical protein
MANLLCQYVGPFPLSGVRFIYMTLAYDDSHLKTGAEPSAEMSCTLNMPQTINNVQHNVDLLLG